MKYNFFRILLSVFFMCYGILAVTSDNDQPKQDKITKSIFSNDAIVRALNLSREVYKKRRSSSFLVIPSDQFNSTGASQQFNPTGASQQFQPRRHTYK